MNRLVIAPLVLVLAVGASSASAVVSATSYTHRLHLGEVYQQDGAPVEVQMYAYTGSAIDNGEAFDFGPEMCVSLHRATEDGGVGEDACGVVTVEVVPGLTSMRVAGSLEGYGYAYAYDPEEGPTWTDLGPSEVSVDLLLTGTGDPRIAEPGVSPGVCGLPPDTRGAGLIADVALARDATVSGGLDATNAGAVDASTLTGILSDYLFAYAFACVD
jgi:hypothetical protein